MAKLTPFNRARLLRFLEHSLVRLHAGRCVALVVCAFAISRVVSEPNWAATAALLAASIAFLGCELAVWAEALSRTTERVDTQSSDRKLFLELHNLLEASHFIDFLREGGLQSPFSLNRLDPMDAFLHEWKKPVREFLDLEIDKHRQDLVRVCNLLSLTIAYETFPLDNGLQHLPPEWQSDDRERMDRAFNLLVDQSAVVVATWDTMIRTTRRRLSIISG